MQGAGLLVNLVAALGVAAIGALVAQRLRLPAMVGYVLAGVVIGPFTPGSVGDVPVISALADLGVVLLMFAVGARLPLRELRRVGAAATVGGLLQVAASIALGTALGAAIGLGPLESVFLGAVVSNSSSTVLTKLLGERGEVDSLHGRLALAWSSVQDLSTVVLIVVLTSFAGGTRADPTELALAVGRAAIFLVVLVLIGGRLLDRLLRLRTVLASREVFVVALAAGALAVAFLSTRFGLSLALGAFAAGMVVAETDVAHHALAQITPVRDVFAAVFFVAVGMLVHPRFLSSHATPFIVVFASIVLAKPLVSIALARMLGTPLSTSVLAGVLLGQSAEFSFLLARVGVDTGALSEESANVALSACVASVVFAPVSDRLARRFARRLRTAEPPRDDREHAPEPQAVVCGYGRVGAAVCDALTDADVAFSVIDDQAPTVRDLRARGIDAVLGDASHPLVLERAGAFRARLVVVAVPDTLDARATVDHVRDAAPDAVVIARTHSAADHDALVRRGVSHAFVGEVELARSMARCALEALDVPAVRVGEIVLDLTSTAPPPASRPPRSAPDEAPPRGARSRERDPARG